MVAITSFGIGPILADGWQFRSNFDDDSGLSLWGIAKELSSWTKYAPMHGLGRQASLRQDDAQV